MLSFLKKHSLLLSVLLLLSIFGLALFYPPAVPVFVAFCILFAFVAGAAFIVEKHKGQESARRKIAKDILIFAITFALTILLGEMVSQFAASYAGAYVEVRWDGMGMLAGFAAAILASFAVGYAVKWGMRKLSRGVVKRASL